MKIIVGLGNPGKEYDGTRHNSGFMLVDYLRQEWQFPEFSLHKKFDAEISEGVFNGEKIQLVKTQTFMNLSGTSVKKIIDFYKLSADDILVAHDDIDIVRGNYRAAVDSSSAGHNGVQNIIDTLGTKKIFRLRIGISRTPEEKETCRMEVHDYVLGKLSSEEIALVETTFPKIKNEIETWIHPNCHI